MSLAQLRQGNKDGFWKAVNVQAPTQFSAWVHQRCLIYRESLVLTLPCRVCGQCSHISSVSANFAGRKLVEIGGRLPAAAQFHQFFVKILSKHLATNKKVSFVFQQKSSTKPMMNPSPSEIVELFSFVESHLYTMPQSQDISKSNRIICQAAKEGQ